MSRFIFLFSFFLVNCFSTINPKFDVTTEPTAIEKQIIGEDKEIEKDGWLISSIKSSSIGTELWKKDTSYYNEIGFTDKSYKEVLMVLFYYEPEIQKYKSKGIIGEGLNGLLAFVDSQKRTDRINSVLKLVNDSRVRVFETKVLSLLKKNLKQEEFEQQKKNYLLENYYLAEKGEFIQEKNNSWVRKK